MKAVFTPRNYQELLALSARLDRKAFSLENQKCDLVQAAMASPKEQAWTLGCFVWLKSDNSRTSSLTAEVVDRINAAIQTWDFRCRSASMSLAGALECAPVELLDPVAAISFLRGCLEQPTDGSIGSRALRIAASTALGRLHRRIVPGAEGVLRDHLDDPDASIANNARIFLKYSREN
ncbi:MAG: hypothetical protein ACKV19_25520 [Verrucomicrobiales bacterium]